MLHKAILLSLFVFSIITAQAQDTPAKKTHRVSITGVELAAQGDVTNNYASNKCIRGNLLDMFDNTIGLPNNILSLVPSNFLFRELFPPTVYNYSNYIIYNNSLYYYYYSGENRYNNGMSGYANMLLGLKKKDGSNTRHSLKIGLGYSYKEFGYQTARKETIFKTDTIGTITYYDGNPTDYLTEDSTASSLGKIKFVTNSILLNLTYYYTVADGNKISMSFGLGTDIGLMLTKSELYSRTNYSGNPYSDKSAFENFNYNTYILRPNISIKTNYRITKKSRTSIFCEGRWGKDINGLNHSPNLRKTFMAVNFGVRYNLHKS